MKNLAVLPLAFLVACTAPGPHFRDLSATRIQVEGSTFDVRVRGELAESLRVNPEYAPRLGRVGARAATAMTLVSGCKVMQVRGDQALATGILDCGQTGVRRVPIAFSSGEYECIRTDRWSDGGSNGVYEEYDCTPY